MGVTRSVRQTARHQQATLRFSTFPYFALSLPTLTIQGTSTVRGTYWRIPLYLPSSSAFAQIYLSAAHISLVIVPIPRTHRSPVLRLSTGFLSRRSGAVVDRYRCVDMRQHTAAVRAFSGAYLPWRLLPPPPPTILPNKFLCPTPNLPPARPAPASSVRRWRIRASAIWHGVDALNVDAPVCTRATRTTFAGTFAFRIRNTAITNIKDSPCDTHGTVCGDDDILRERRCTQRWTRPRPGTSYWRALRLRGTTRLISAHVAGHLYVKSINISWQNVTAAAFAPRQK